MNNYQPERRSHPQHSLSDEEIELIAEKAAEKAVEKITAQVYQTVGRTIIGRVTWLIGASADAFALWVNNHGGFK